MQLRPFNFKLPQDEAKRKKYIMTILGSLLIIILITLASSFAYYQSIEIQNPYNTSVGSFTNGDVIFAVNINGVPSQTFMTKTAGYGATVDCDKGAVGIWDNDAWSVKVFNLTQTKTACTVNFESAKNLNSTILAEFGGTAAITTIPQTELTWASSPTTAVMYRASDDYGISYYYRGAKDLLKNNLIFAGFQWKIVRINGNNTVRLIYNGTAMQFNNTGTMNSTGPDTQTGTSVFNSYGNDNKYVGYMFGGAAGSASPNRATAITNSTNSTVKTYLDNWYLTNIVNQGSGVTSKIADVLFCNDRQLSQGNGYGTSMSTYMTLTRTNGPTFSQKLTCTDKNDRFTVSDTSYGNAALTYPVGLINMDELTLAGGHVGVTEESFYLYTGQGYWTMAPNGYNGAQTVVYSMGSAFPIGESVLTARGVRPSINITNGTQVVGDGTATNPFRVI